MTLTVKLADEERYRLEVIVKSLKSSNQSEAIRTLINEKFELLQSDLTLLERRGGLPEHVLNTKLNLSERSNRKAAIENILGPKTKRRAR